MPWVSCVQIAQWLYSRNGDTWTDHAIQALTEESLQQDIFDLGETSPPKPKKKSLGGRDVFVEALSYGLRMLPSQEWQKNRMVIKVFIMNPPFFPPKAAIKPSTIPTNLPM